MKSYLNIRPSRALSQRGVEGSAYMYMRKHCDSFIMHIFSVFEGSNSYTPLPKLTVLLESTRLCCIVTVVKRSQGCRDLEEI